MKADGPSGAPVGSQPGVPHGIVDNAVARLSVSLQQDRSMAVSNGGVLVEALHPEAVVHSDEASAGCVLGLQCSSTAPASFLEVAIGKLRCRRFAALSRAKLYWMIPQWGSKAEQVPVETQLLLMELKEGAGYALLAPLIDRDKFRTSLRPPRRHVDPADSVLLRIESGDESVRDNQFKGVLYAAAGTDPFELLDRGVAAAARLSGSGRPRWEKEEPASLDCFGWCSWDACYTAVCPKALQDGLMHLAQGGTPARLLVIDDGWQHMDVDAHYKTDADGGVLHGWSNKPASELHDKLTMGRLLAGTDLQTVEPLHVMELLKKRADSSSPKADEARTAAVNAELKCRTANGHTDGETPPHGSAWGPASAIVPLRDAAFGAFALLLRLKRRAELAAAGWLRDALEEASSDSYRMRAFAAAAVGPLRKAILRFYAQASTHSYRLLSIKANAKFDSINNGDEAPLDRETDNFGSVVRELKKRCGVQYVYCWHAMMGYWSGCMPGAPSVAKYKPRLMYPRPSPGTLEVDPSMQWVHPAVNGVALVEDPRPFHNDLHTYLHECGVDGVKVDVQATITMFGHDRGGYASMGARWHRSLEDSVAAHLPGNHQINSMCCAMEDIYNMSHSNIGRVGEDFYPALPASHQAHIANASFTTLMMGVMAWPDWDMFHSDHGSSHLHAAARAISGGLVYVSDRVGEHDFSLLRRLVLPDGSVLRCRLPGRPTVDCLFSNVSQDRQTVLKVWNMNRVTGVVGLFNVQGSTWAVRRRAYYTHDPNPPTLRAEVRPGDVPYLPQATRYAVWSDKLQDLRILAAQGGSWQLSVRGGGGHDLLTISPLLEGGLGEHSVAVAPIGLVNMMNAGGAVLKAELAEGSDEDCSSAPPTLHLELCGCGRFLLYASRRPAAVQLDGQPAEGVEWDERRGAVWFSVPWREEKGGLGSRKAVIKF